MRWNICPMLWNNYSVYGRGTSVGIFTTEKRRILSYNRYGGYVYGDNRIYNIFLVAHYICERIEE